MDMQSFLGNPWTSGIGGGIISGLIVFYVTRWFIQRRDKSGYINSVHNANKQVIDLLKAYVVDKGLPDAQIVRSIISATAREFSVKREEMFDVIVICEELIKEIIGNVYVSGDQKQKYLEDLRIYVENIEDFNYNINSSLENIVDARSRKHLFYSSYQYISMVLGIVTGLLVISFTIVYSFLDKHYFFYYEPSSLVIVFGVMMLILISFYMAFLFIKLKKNLMSKMK
ncbi:hypothetical protein [Akkermansia sp.]|uniref:hypothetical protein n=1 Tax=Akkermansia sp. TaxID=1872421 RepID=UPI003AF6C893